MTCRWGSEVAFDGSLLGVASASMQGSPPKNANYTTFDVNGVIKALEDLLPDATIEESTVRQFTDAVRESIKVLVGSVDRTSPDDIGALGFEWMGPLLSPLVEGRGTDAAALAEAMKASADHPPVALGIVDTSIAFANRRFRVRGGRGRADRTRFKMLWLQDRYFDARRQYNTPSGYSGILGPGTLLLERDINAIFERNWIDGELDEDGVYREFASVRPFGRDLWSLRGGHGTSVLDLMGGAEPGGDGSDRPIYAVELPTSVVADTSGGQFHGPLTVGLAVISFFSFLMGNRANLVMNASMSFVGGPHTSTRNGGKIHPTAKALNRLVRISQSGNREVRLTLPAGNHLQDQLTGESYGATWVVPPNDRTGSTLEIWRRRFKGFSGVRQSVLSLGAPGCNPVILTDLPSPGHYVGLFDDDREIARLFRFKNNWLSDHLVLGVFPTESHAGADQLSPAGFWTVQIKGLKCRFFSLRDDTLAGLPEAGQQSRLRDESYRKFQDDGSWTTSGDTSRVGTRRDGSVSVLAAGKLRHGRGFKADTTLITGYETSRRHGIQPYRFSGLELDCEKHSGGPVTMAEVARSLGGPLAAARMGRGKIRWAGTSMASAIAARLFADGFAETPARGEHGVRDPANNY